MGFEAQTSSAERDAEGSLQTHHASDGYEIAYRYYCPAATPPRGQIIALHGIQSHSGWYTASCRQLAAAGYEVWFPDRRGSGKNSRERGHVSGIERWFDDINEFLVLMTEADAALPPDKTLPRFLMGLSWGAKLALAHTAVRPYGWAGVVLLYPGIYTRVRIKPWQQQAIRLLYHARCRRMRFSIPLNDSDLFTRRPEARQMIENDRDALHRVSVSFLYATGQLDRLAFDAPRHLFLPTICQLAGDDQIVDNAQTRKLLDEFATEDMTVIEYPNARHTLEFEPNREEIVGDVVKWLDRVVTAIM